MMAKIVLTLTQRIAALEQLRAVCTKTPEGLAVFQPGWDDHKVAALLGAPYNPMHIQTIRKEMIGMLYTADRPRRSPAGGSLEERLTTIEDYLTRKNPLWRETLL
jgi:hypothetical protein